MLHLDFETRSACDLKSAGAEVYARHPSTDIMCLGYALDPTPAIRVWVPNWQSLGLCEPLDDIFEYVKSGGKCVAHNAAFELAIWNNVGVKVYGFPPLSPGQIECTMAMAYAMSLPGSLEKCAPAAGIQKEKDMHGSRVMLQLSKPKSIKDGLYTYWNDPVKFREVVNYCAKDVDVERDLSKKLQSLSPSERDTWQLDYRINQRGVPIDIDNAKRALEIVELEQRRLDERMREVSNNAIATCRATAQIKDFLVFRGVDTPGVSKSDLLALLERDLDPVCKEVIELRQEAGKSSTAKLKAMIERAGTDGRVRGILQYHGASTGRWAGRGIQVQNFPRPNLEQDDIERVIEIISKHEAKAARDMIHLLHGSVLSAISSSLRAFIKAPKGYDFIGGDWSAIEARVLCWLADERKDLKVFRTHGKIYEQAASIIYKVPIEKVTLKQRQIGKVAVLALGYQGGQGAFQQMAKGYGLKVSNEEAEQIKTAWREGHPNIVHYWYELERAAQAAIRDRGRVFNAGPSDHRQIRYVVKGSFLWCRLPSGRLISYPYPRLTLKETPWGQMKECIAYRTEDSLTKKWGDTLAYGGLLCENITQAVARDVLRDALFRLEAKHYPIVMHVHDEVLAEIPKKLGSVEELESIMCEGSSWSAGLPLRAEGWRGERYQK